MKFIYTLSLLALSFSLFSQRGKDGTPTITAANTIVNAYTPLTSNVTSGSTTLNVGSSAAFAVGDLVYIIQMQGVNVNAYDGSFTGPWYDGNSAIPTDTTYGKITNYNNTGMNEFAQINSIPNSTSIVIDCGLKNTYDVTKNYTTASGKNIVLLGNVQVIRVPRYSFLTLSGAATITCPQWNGSTGGVAVVEVENNTILNSAGAFNVSGKGFRGGTVFNYNLTTFVSSDKYGSNISSEGGAKGESIAGDSAMYRNYASVFCRGNLANGGGGGNSHNAGGGGGANGHNGVNFNSRGNPVAGFNTIWNLETANFSLNTSSGGGRGGYSFSDQNRNVSSVPPGTIPAPNWGGDNRKISGGFGGRPLNYTNDRLFLGGGGGAGQGNNNQASAGGNGGGLAYLICYGNLSGSGTILANGANASNTGTGCGQNDGAGGGGGGGAIVLNVNGTINLTAGTALSANGGNGGNVNFGICANNTAYGPGAGGGGGHIASTGALPSNSIVGGNNGTVTGNANNIGNNFPPNGATRGGSGGTGSVTAYTLNASASQTLCTNQAFTLTASSTEPGTSINWYNTLVGGSAIATGTAYASPGYTTAGTYTLFAGACSGTYRQPITITVNAGLNIAVNSPTICPTQTVTLTASGATTYTWVTGAPNSNTLSVSPSSTTIYTVNATSGTCVGSNTTAVVVSAVPTLTVANANICSGNSAILTASGASSYTLSPSTAFTTTVSVNPTTTTNYTITGSNGACTNTIATTVSVTATPTITGVANTTICPTQTVSFSAVGANSFTWQPTNFVGATYTIAPVSSTTVSVIGANGTCTSSATATITIGTGISITVNNPTICAGQTATLTASGGATTYTWSSGPPNTNTLSISPAITTTYTILGTNGTCSGSNTAVVTVVSVPSVSVTNSAICSGNSATLTASGANTYTWAPSGQTTSSISDNPNGTTIYTVTGSNGICTNTATGSISVTATPTLVANSVTICTGQTATLTASGATTFNWNPGNVNATSYTIAPSTNTFVTVIGANGTCTSSAIATITIGTGISITVNNPTICVGQTATLTASGGATTYTWSSGPPNTNTLSISPAITTTYSVLGTNGTCSGSNTAVVTVVSVPSVSVTNSAICSGNSATLTASGANTYTWAPNGQTTSSISENPNTTTIYTVTGSNGICTNTATGSISVTAIPTITGVANATICAAQTVTYTATGANSFTWQPTNFVGATYTIAPVSSTTVSVVGAIGTCTSSATATVTVDNTVLSTYTLALSTCPTETVALFGTGTNSATTTYTWSNGVNTFSQTVAPINTTTYVVNGTSLSGCPALSGTVIVNVNSISASFSGLNSTIMSVGETLNLTNTSTGASSILWDYCNGISTNSVVTVPLTDTGSCCITLVATNATCKDSVTKCVTIIKEAVVVIPNVFTPNGDTKNDIFKIASTGLKSLNCVIYDRWGLKMYEWDGVNGYWDGNTKTGNASDGTYFYIINYTDLKDKSVTEKGYLNLFK